jgi:hypothetical protein
MRFSSASSWLAIFSGKFLPNPAQYAFTEAISFFHSNQLQVLILRKLSGIEKQHTCQAGTGLLKIPRWQAITLYFFKNPLSGTI